MPTKVEFAQQLRQQYPGPTARYKSDEELVDAWVKTNPEDAGKIDSGSSFSPVATALRVVPAVFASEGGLPGAALAGGGETAAQLYEWLTQNKAIRPTEIAAESAIGAIPFTAAGKELSTLAKVGRQAAKGAAIGGASNVISDALNEKRLPDAGEFATHVAAGGVLGGATEGLLSKFAQFKKAAGLAEDTAKVAEPVTKAATQVPAKVLTTETKGGATKMKFMNTSDFEGEKMNSLPQAGEIPAGRKFDFPSLQKMPEEIRPDIENLLKEHGGYEAQRRGVQPIELTNAMAERLTVPLTTIKPGTALNAEELVAYRDSLASVLTEQKSLAQKIASDPNASDLDRARLTDLTNRGSVLLSSYRGAKAETGRALNILRTQARVFEFGDSGFQQALLDSPGFKGNADKIAQAIVEAGDDPVKQLQILQKNAGGSLGDKAMTLYYNSLLSGVKTHLRNTIGNTFNLMANMANPLVAGPVDRVRVALKGGERQVLASEFSEGVTSLFQSLPQAWSKAMFTMRNGFSPKTIDQYTAGKLDVSRLAELPGGMATNFPTRALQAADDFFRTLAHNMESTQSAYTAAKKAGLKEPGSIADYMSKVMVSPENRQGAEKFAAKAVFQEDPGTIINTMIRWKVDPSISLPMRTAITFIVPFVRTPANILRQGLEASPAGFLMNAAKEEGRMGAQNLGKSAMGSLVLAPVAFLAATGRLSGNGPTDPGERAALLEKGWQSNSVKIGNSWVKYQLFQPWSVPLAIVANGWDKFNQSDKSDKAAEQTFVDSIAAAGASVIDQSFLSGVNGLLDAVSDPDRYGSKFLATMAQGMVPGSGMLRNVTQAIDPVVRKPQGIAESVESIIPGLSTNVPARLTRFGEEVTRQGNPIRRGFTVPEVSTEQHDPVGDMLERMGVTPQVPKAKLTDVVAARKDEVANARLGKPKTPGAGNVKLNEDQTQAIEQAIGQERYSLLSRNPRMNPREVDKILSEVTRSVNERAMSLIRRGQPVTLDTISPKGMRKFNKGEIDRLYNEYLNGSN